MTTPTTLEHLSPDTLVDYENNSRTHTDAQVGKIAKAIEEFGFLNPVIVDADNTIIAGHARVRAAKQLKLATVPCLRATHLSDAQKRAYVIADNRLALDAGWDDAILRRELHDLSGMGFNLNVTGMGEEELRKLVQTRADYQPNLNPQRGSDQFTQNEVDSAQRRLAGQFEDAGRQDLVPITCPHCGEDFSLARSAIVK